MSEKDWPETDKLDPYAKSKTLAEKAAWDFVKELKGRFKLDANSHFYAHISSSYSACQSRHVFHVHNICRVLHMRIRLLPSLELEFTLIASSSQVMKWKYEVIGMQHIVLFCYVDVLLC